MQDGNGGKVIVWADEITRFYGNVTARGGANSGNGGFVETSGKQFLDVRGSVNTLAARGAAGMWLLDPTSITTQAGAGSFTLLSDVDAFGKPDAGGNTIDVAVINGAGSNVTLRASDFITFGAGAPINTAALGVGLTAQAGRLITVNSNITTNNGAVSLVANETLANGVVDGARTAGAAAITMAAGTTINAGNASIGLTVSTGAGLTNSTSGSITLANLTTTGNIAVANNGLSAGSDINLQDATVQSGGTMNVSATGNLNVTANTAATVLQSAGAQTIAAKRIKLDGGGGAGTNVSASITQSGAAVQSITAGSGGIALNAGSGSGGGNNAQINQSNAAGSQSVIVNGGNVALLGGTGNATNNAGIGSTGTAQTITVNDAASVSVIAQTGDASITSTGDQTLMIQGALSANALTVGSAAAANTSSITGKNQNLTAGTAGQSGSIAVAGGIAVAKPSRIQNTGGTQTVSTVGTLALTGGTAAGTTGGCGSISTGSCAFIINNAATLAHITANKIDMKGGGIGGSVGSNNAAGIFSNGGNITLDVGAGGLSIRGGDGDTVLASNNATIGGSIASGGIFNINVEGNTTITGGGTSASGADIGIFSPTLANGGSITINLNTAAGTHGNVTLTGGGAANAGAVIGVNAIQTNATTNLAINGADNTLTPGAGAGARLGHANGANGPGDITVTATGNIVLNGTGVNGGSIRTTGNVTLQAAGAGKSIVEQSSASILANNLTAIADAGITLTSTNNAVSNFAAKNNSAGVISLTNTAPLSIFNDTVAAVNGLINTGRDITLNNNGAVTQSAPITAAGLELKGTGPFTLTNAGNDIATLAAGTAGAISYTDSNAMTVGTVNTAGIASSGNDVTLNAGGTVSIANNINAGAGFVKITTAALSAGDIQGTGGTIISTNSLTGIKLDADGAIGTSTGTNPVRTNIVGGGKLDLTTHGAAAAGNITLVEAGPITTGPAGNINGLNWTGTGHTLTLTSTAGPLTLANTAACGVFCLDNDATWITLAGDILFQGTVANDYGAGTVRFVSAGAITSSAAFVGGTAAAVGLRAVNDIDLSLGTPGNVGTIAAFVSGAGKFVSARNGGPVTIGTVGADITGAFASTSGITTNNGNVTLKADNISLVATTSTGAGVVTLSTLTPGQIINIGAGATNSLTVLGFSDSELNTITSTGGLTIGTTAQTGGIVVVGDANPTGVTAGTFNLTTGGAITRSAGTLGTSGTTNLALNAHTGIGTLAAPVVIGTLGGNLSAVNGPNAGGSGDIALSTGAITLGASSAVIDQQVAGGAIAVTSSGDITIGGNLAVSGGGASTIILDATGAIAEAAANAGTLTAATIKLGTAGTTTAIGSAGATGPIMTAATTLLDARSSAGDVWLSNTGNLSDANAQAIGGLVNIANTGTLSTTTGILTSTTGSVTVSSTDNMSIGNTVTGPTGVSLTVSGAERILTHSAGSIDGTNAPITLTADKMALTGGTIGSASGDAVTLTGNVAANAIVLGNVATNNTPSTLELSNTELNTIVGALTIGSASTTGAITVSNAINPLGATGGLTLLNNTGGIAVNAALTSPAALTLAANGGGAATGAISGSGAIGATSLTATAATGITLGGASTVQTVSLTNTQTGSISYTGSAVGAANTLTVAAVTNTVSGTGDTFTVTETTGSLAVGAIGIATKSGSVNLTASGAGKSISSLAGSNIQTNAAGAGAAVTLKADNMSLAGTTTAGAGVVTLTTNAPGQIINIGGVAADSVTVLGLTAAELNTIVSTGGLTVGTTAQTGGIVVVGDANPTGVSAGTFNLTTAGAITSTAGTLATSGIAGLSLNARTGIGAVGTPIVIGTVGGNLSADNSTGATAGDVVLKTGTITIGSAGTSILERSTGTIQIDATIAATDSLTIAGNMTAPGAGGTITLNAGAGGTITRTGGTLTANTVKLGTTSAKSVGALGAPIVTAATTLLDARAGAGDVWVTNTGNLNVTAQATGGLVNIANTGTLTTSNVVTSSSGSVTLASTDNMSIGDNVSAGGSGAVNLSVSGAQKQLSHTAATISTANGPINLTADNMDLGAGANKIAAGTAGAINVTSKTAGNTIDLGAGGAPTAGKLELAASELNTFQTTGVLTIGDAAHSGGIIVSANAATANVTGGTTLLNNTGGIAVNRVLTAGSGSAINLIADGNAGLAGTVSEGSNGGVVGGLLTTRSNGGTVLDSTHNQVTGLNAINAGTGNVALTNAAATLTVSGVTQNSGDVTVINTGNLVTSGAIVTAANGNIALNTSGNETIGAAVTAGGAGAVTLQSTGNGAVTVNTGQTVQSTSGAILLRADSVALNGTAAVTTGAGGVQLRPQAVNDTIGLEDTAQSFNVTDATLSKITTTGTITIGDAAHRGNISVTRNAAINQGAKNIALISQGTNNSNIDLTGLFNFTARDLTLKAGGAITQTTATTGKLISTRDLALSATKGIGSTTGPAPIVIGTVGGNLSADNSTGATAGDVVLQTGTVTVGSAGTSILERTNGTIQIDATNAATDSLTIGGDMTAPGGSGTIILNAGTAGTITRTGGTLTANTVKLGVTSAQSVGTTLAPVVTAATTLLDARAGAGDVWVANTGVVNATAKAIGGLVNLQNSGGALTVASGGITSSSGGVTVNNTGNAINVNNVVTAGGTGVASLTSVGLTNTSTITGPGGVTIDAGTGTLTNSAGTAAITNGVAAPATAVTLTADKMILGSTASAIQGGAGVVTLQQKTNGTAIDLGTGGDGGFGLSNSELRTVATTGALRVGNANSGAISISGAITPVVATTRLTSGAGISGVSTFTGTSLALVAGGVVDMHTAVTNLAASTTAGGSVTVGNTTAGTLNVTTVDTIAGMNVPGPILLVEQTGNVSVVQPVSASGALNISVSGLNKQFANSGAGTLTNNGSLAITADNMSLGANVSTMSQAIVISPSTAATQIRLGVGAVDGPGILAIDDTELLRLSNNNGLYMGSLVNSGGITVVGAGALTNVTGGLLTLQSNSGNIAFNNTLTYKTGGNTTVATASGNITFDESAGRLDATGKTVTLTATAGSIGMTGGAANFDNIVANTLSATAPNGFGSAANPVQTNVGSLSVDTSGASGGIHVLQSNGVTLQSITAGSGTINITGSTGNILVGTVTTTGTASLTASAGSINEATIDDGAPVTDISASSASLTAATGIGTASRLDLNVPTVTLATTGAGGIRLRDAAATSVFTNVNTTTSGAIDLLTTGAATLTSISSANGPVTVNAGGNIIVGSVSAAGNAVTLATTNGTINEATNDDAGAISSDITAASASLTATTGIGASSRLDLNVPTVTLATTSTGGIRLRDAAPTSVFTNVNTTAAGAIDLLTTGAATLTGISSANGAVTVNAAGNIIVGSVSAAGNAVTLATTNGTINEATGDDGAPVTDISALSASLTATTGIGTASRLDLDVPTVTLATTNTGGIRLRDAAATSVFTNVNTTGAGTIDLLTTGAATLTSINSANGAVTVNAGGNIIVGSVSAAGNLVALATTNGTINEATNDDGAPVTDISAASASLTATTGIGTTSRLDLNVPTVTLATTDTGGIRLRNAAATAVFTNVNTTTSGAIDLLTTGPATLTSISSANGPVTVNAGGNVIVGSVSAAGSAVTLATTNGTINEATNDDGAPVTDISAASASLTATTGIGTTSRLDLNVPTVTLATTNTGGVRLRDAAATSVFTNVNTTTSGTIDLLTTGAATLTSVSSANGPLIANAGGDIIVGTVSAAGNTVALATTNGAINEAVNDDGAPTTNISAAIASLTATTGIGTTSRLDLNVPTVSLASTSTGGIQLRNAAATSVFTNVNTTTAGAIDLLTTGAATLTSISSANGPVTVNAGGNMIVGSINAAGNAVTLATTSGTINEAANDDGAPVTDITAASTSLTATTGIGTTSRLDLNVPTVTLATTSTGGIRLRDAAATSLFTNVNTATSGAIDLLNTGAATLTSIVSANGAVTVSAGGNILVGSVSALGNSVSLNSTGGSILDDGSNATAITAQTLNLTVDKNGAGSLGGAGGNAELDVNVATLNLNGVGSGGVYITSSGSMALVTDNTKLNANTPFTIHAGGSLTLPANALDTGSGSIDFQSNGGTLATGGNLTTTTGTISLTGSAGIVLGHNLTTAGADITLNNNATLTNNVQISTGAAAPGDIMAQAIAGDSPGAPRNLTLISGSGLTTVNGNVGSPLGTSPSNIGTLTLQANNAGATGKVTFDGTVNANTITTFSQPYAIAFNAGTAVTTDTTFLNTGAITLGNGGDTLTFRGGLDTTAASTTNIAGIVRTAGAQIDIGALKLGADSAVDATNNGGSSGGANIKIASVDGMNVGALTLNAGTTGALEITGNTVNLNGYTSDSRTAILDGPMTVSGAVNVRAFNGDLITKTGLITSTTGNVNLKANSTGAPAVLTIGPGGVTSVAGDVNLKSADGITVNGTISAQNGAATLIAGSSSGMAAFGVTPATVGAGGGMDSPITINAPILAGSNAALTVSLFSTGEVTQSTGNVAGIQTNHAGNAGAPGMTGGLHVVVFNDAGKKIDLQNSITVGSPICGTAVGGTGTGNCVGPVDLRTLQGDGSPFSAGNINYTSINNLNVATIGSSGIAVLKGPSLTLTNFPTDVRAHDVYLFATNGDVNMNIPVTNAQVNGGNPGGSWQMYASGNININNPGAADAGVSFGRRIGTDAKGMAIYEIFNHDLKMVATGDLNIHGSIISGGSLALRADAHPSEVALANVLSGTTTPRPGDGQGGVSIINTGVAPGFGVEVRGTNITVGAPGARAQFLTIQAGTATATAGNPIQRGDAMLVSNGPLSVYLSGDLNLKGGAATVEKAAGITGQATAIASLAGDHTLLEIGGNATIKGGIGPTACGTFGACALGGLAATFTDVGADASAYINAPILTGTLDATIHGSLTVTGGNAAAGPDGGHAVASATLSGSTVVIDVGNGTTLQGGIADAVSGTGAGNCSIAGGICATAVALINSGNQTKITDTGPITIKGGAANAIGTAAAATALAGVIDHAASQLVPVMMLASGVPGIQLTGGLQTTAGGGVAKSDATIVSGGGIQLRGGIKLTGGTTGLIQTIGNPPTIFRLDGNAPPIELFGGGKQEVAVTGSGDAFVFSGAPPSNLDPLLAGLLSALDVVKSGVKALDADRALLASKDKNYCK